VGVREEERVLVEAREEGKMLVAVVLKAELLLSSI
jgi:hypothetical protein